MTIQELMKEHVKEECRYCILKECNGIHITRDNKTICERKNGMFRNK